MASATATIKRIWQTPELRKDIIFVLCILVVFRLLAHVPIPGVDPSALRQFFQNNQLLGLLNVFSGGGLERLSVVMLGVGPYITSSIVFQLLGMAVPRIEAMQKDEGEAGRQKINQWTRLLTVPLTMLQAYGFIAILKNSSGLVSQSLTGTTIIIALIVVTGGTLLLMWLGELISERRLGNGISLLIFAGIVSALPRTFQQTLSVYDPSQLVDLILFAAVALITVASVVYVTEAQRNIPVSYARQVRGAGMYGASSTYLPLRVNMAGVIPIIFAVSLVLLPPTVARFLQQSSSMWLKSAADFIVNLFANQIFYAAIYGFLVFIFTFFYTYVIFQPKQVAENLQKQGGFIPGIRPGAHTADYLQFVTNRILLAGALFLAAIAVLPVLLRSGGGLSGSLVIGGTSILIVVSVVIETVKQIQAQLVMRDYEKL